jgi:hypothetical protein
MSASNGSFSAPLAPDLAKEVEAFLVRIAAGVGVAAVVNPAQPQSSVTVYNVSNNWLKATWTFTAGITSLGTAATRVSIIPPGGTLSLDAADEGSTDSVAGSIGAFDSVSLVPVDVPVAAGVVEAGTLTAAAAAQAGYVAVDWFTV